MPYSGGSSTNAGAEYQNWFLALLFSYAFFEKDYEIYPEALRGKSVIVDDILVKEATKKKFFSVKFRAPSNALHWSQSYLNSEDIFSDFKKQFEANEDDDLYLVSECSCYLFTEVFARARNSKMGGLDIEHVLSSKYAIDEWEKAKDHLKYDDTRMIEFARKVNSLTLPLKEIQYLVKHRFSQFSNEKLVSYFLFSKAVETSALKTAVDKLRLNRWFAAEQISFNL